MDNVIPAYHLDGPVSSQFTCTVKFQRIKHGILYCLWESKLLIISAKKPKPNLTDYCSNGINIALTVQASPSK